MIEQIRSETAQDKNVNPGASSDCLDSAYSQIPATMQAAVGTSSFGFKSNEKVLIFYLGGPYFNV